MLTVTRDYERAGQSSAASYRNLLDTATRYLDRAAARLDDTVLDYPGLLDARYSPRPAGLAID
jgi:hypothetical protein